MRQPVKRRAPPEPAGPAEVKASKIAVPDQTGVSRTPPAKQQGRRIRLGLADKYAQRAQTFSQMEDLIGETETGKHVTKAALGNLAQRNQTYSNTARKMARRK